jgi:hypothetical protein
LARKEKVPTIFEAGTLKFVQKGRNPSKIATSNATARVLDYWRGIHPDLLH